VAPGQVPNSQGSGWQVTSQQETVDVAADGKPTAGVRVTFSTDKGITGSVFVSRALYNPANVKAAIAGYVQQLHEVQALSG